MSKPKKTNKSTGQAAGTRSSPTWSESPFDLVIMGLDNDQTDHALCDAESNAHDAESDEVHIATVRLYGVIKPVVFVRVGELKVVVDGRTTVRTCRVIAKRQEAAGEDVIRVPCIVRRGSMDDLFCVSRVTQRRRPVDSEMAQGADLNRLVLNGWPLPQAAERLAIALPRAKQLIALLDMHPKVQRAVGAGMSLDAAAKLAKLPHDQQISKLDEITATGGKPTARAVTNKLREGGDKSAVATPTQRIRTAFTEILRLLAGEDDAEVVDALVTIGRHLKPDWVYDEAMAFQSPEEGEGFGV